MATSPPTPLGLAAFAAVLASLATTGQALAHAHLKAAMPPVDGVVASAPTEIDLVFTEGLNLAFSGVSVTGPAGAPAAIGTPALKTGDDATLLVPIPAPLAAGRYTVDWHALSEDGHKTHGRYRFTVRP